MPFFKTVLLCSILTVASLAQGQNEMPRISYSLATRFQSFSLPLHDLTSHLEHPGFSAGASVAFGKRRFLFQQLQTNFQSNQTMGNSAEISTHFGYRPQLSRRLNGELSLGLGARRNYHPVAAYEFKNGEWIKTAGGHTNLVVPMNMGLGYHFTEQGRSTAFINYQMAPALFYNAVIPLSFYSGFELGIRFTL